jgi:hypothetical protein
LDDKIASQINSTKRKNRVFRGEGARGYMRLENDNLRRIADWEQHASESGAQIFDT